jgi:hypothetical protein
VGRGREEEGRNVLLERREWTDVRAVYSGSVGSVHDIKSYS